MFDNCKNSNIKGNVGLGSAIAYFTEQGNIISLPLNDSQSYDLITDNVDKLLKVQIKTTSQKTNKGIFKVKLEQYANNFNKPFDNTLVDLVFVLCENGDKYLIPSKEIDAKTLIHLGNKYSKYLL